VEDDEDVRNYATGCLRELGYHVLEASRGQAALQVLDHHPEINVLFTDIGLPGGMDGRQLAEEARQRRRTIKVLFTTGYARNAIIHDGRLDPGVELLTKPFTQVALGQKLRDILDAKSVQARVLVIEDEPLIQMLTMDYLQEVGLKVYVAGSAADALNKLRLIPGGIDAAIIDIILPDRDGASLVREIRSVYPSVPFVITSGRGQEELRSHFKDVPLIAMISKPYTADELTAAIRALGIRCSG
jgi:CheY-like chemotaxis protein